MPHNTLQELIKQPHTANSSHITSLQKVIAEYPYLAVAHVLLAKASQNTPAAANMAKKAGFYAPSRKQLQQFLFTKTTENIVTENKTTEISAAPLFVSPAETRIPITDLLPKPTGNEQYSFTAWLQKSRVEKYIYYNNNQYLDIPDYLEADADDAIETNDSLIDRFLQNTPRIVPKADYVNDADLSEKGDMALDEVPVSEPLANILYQQKKWAQARVMYEKLSLQKPEKNTYFAELIKKCQEKESLA